MKLSDVQRVLDKYFTSNNMTALLRQFSNILALFYPIYLIISRISFLNFLTNIIVNVSVLFYIAYLVGLILCFAKNDMLIVTIVFGLKTALEIIDLVLFPGKINSAVSILVYAFIAVAVFKYYRNNSDF